MKESNAKLDGTTKTEQESTDPGSQFESGRRSQARKTIILKSRQILHISVALFAGIYLALVPFGMYAFAQHNPRCLCHGPYQLIQMRWEAMFGK